MKPNPEIGNDRHHPRPTASLRSRPARCGCSGLAGALLTALVLAGGLRAHAQSMAYAFTNFVGQPGIAGTNDGVGNAAQFDHPTGIAVDGSGNLFVADTWNNTIRRVTPEGVVTTIAGSPGNPGSADGLGATALLCGPNAVTVGGAGNLFVADGQNQTIRQLTPVGTNWLLTTLAGKLGTRGHADGIGNEAEFWWSTGLAVDPAGNVFVANCGNNTIRQVSPVETNWVVTTIAGDASQTNVAGLPAGGHADGVGSAASFLNPFGLAMDSAGNLYVADESNCTIRKVTPVGPEWVVTTLAGLWGVSGSTDGANSGARFAFPDGVVVDNTGSVLVADTANNMIRKMTPAGTNWMVSTVAGSALVQGTADGFGSAARFHNPSGVAMDSAGNLYVADTQNHRITKGVPKFAPTITTPGVLSPGLAGAAYNQTLTATGGQTPYTWSVVSNSLPAAFSLDSASGLLTGQVLDPCVVNFRVRVTGADALLSEQRFNLTIAASPSPVIRTGNSLPPGAVGSPYTLTLVAGGGVPPYTWSVVSNSLPAGLSLTSDGLINGTLVAATSATFVVAVAGSDGLVTTNTFTLAVDPALPTTDVYGWTNFVGKPGVSGTNDGVGSAAGFNRPMGVAVDDAGNVFVADYSNCTIRKATPAGEVTTQAGSPGKPGTADGSVSAARFGSPASVSVDRSSSVLVADQMNHTVRKLTLANLVATLAGNASLPSGSADGTNSAARFSTLSGVVADSAGNVFVADTLNHTIRKVTPVGLDWVVTTVAGKAGTAGTADGTNATPRFNRPAGIALDSAGNLFVADQANHAIRELSPVGTNWVVTTLAGKAGYAGSTDGDGSVARFSNPVAVAVDSAGNVFVADGGNKTIRKATPVGTNWLVTTIGGTAGVAGSADGIGSSASFGQPAGIAVDRAGNLYVADFSTHRLAKGTPSMLRPTITVGFNQAQLSLSWPPEYLGWSMQAQTNTPGAGLGTNWFLVPGSATTNQWTIPLDLASPGAFFQLRQGP